MRSITRFLFLTALFTWPIHAEATDYTFTKIADTSGPFDYLFTPSINDSGTVAFIATLDAGGEGVFIGNGTTITTVADDSGPFFAFAEYLRINNSNKVAFIGWPDTVDRSGVFISDGTTTTTIDDTTGPFIEFQGLSINNNNVVAFIGRRLIGGFINKTTDVVTGDGTTVTTIADDSGKFDGFYETSINDSGTVAFIATLDAGGKGVFIGDGTTITTVADDSGPFMFFNGAEINSGGAVAFSAGPDIGGLGIFIYDGIATTKVVDDSGPFDRLWGFGLNDSGTVAFYARLDGGVAIGIFTGPDPVADKVIQTGDALFGSTVTNIEFYNDALNNSSQIAFRAELADGRQIIARADPQFEFLTFPLEGEGPWTKNVSAVLDHSVKTDKNGVPFYYKNDLNGVVQPYAGVSGIKDCGLKDFKECVQLAGKFVRGYKNEDDSPFFTVGDINYTGGGGCQVNGVTVACISWLFYDGHAGYDYPASLGTPIVAPADGYLFVPETDPVTAGGGTNPKRAGAVVNKFFAMALKHDNGFTTWYLHVGREKGTAGFPQSEQDFRTVAKGEEPVFVEQGMVIGMVGNKGLCGMKDINQHACNPDRSHLHFEVRTGVTEFRCEAPTCQVVDPYGPGPRLWLEAPPE